MGMSPGRLREGTASAVSTEGVPDGAGAIVADSSPTFAVVSSALTWSESLESPSEELDELAECGVEGLRRLVGAWETGVGVSAGSLGTSRVDAVSS